MKIPFLVLFMSCLILCLTAQTSITGDFSDRINAIIDALPGADSGEYAPPSNVQLMDWESLLFDIFNADYANATTKANDLNYDLIEFTDATSSKVYYILEADTGVSTPNYWGTYVFYPNACRNIVLQAPHPRKDTNTGKQSTYIFETLSAYALMIAGTNRCNETDHSSCSGTSSACLPGSATEQFRKSDMAHVVETIWQQSTQTLFTSSSDRYFIQLHGFSKKTTDPYVILSNSSSQMPSGTDYLAVLRTQLQVVDPVLDSKIAHLDSWTRLVGFTNTQGRYINSSPDPCGMSATMNTGRFLHVEQEKSQLREDKAGWQKMATALAQTFTGTSCPLIAVDVAPKVFLQGAFNGVTMDANLSSLLPSTEPYTALGYAHLNGGGGETANASLLSSGTIVDWVVVELRAAEDASLILASSAALLKTDGTVVALDGSSAVQFPLPDDNYYVAIRHRNHLSVMGNLSMYLD